MHQHNNNLLFFLYFLNKNDDPIKSMFNSNMHFVIGEKINSYGQYYMTTSRYYDHIDWLIFNIIKDDFFLQYDSYKAHMVKQWLNIDFDFCVSNLNDHGIFIYEVKALLPKFWISSKTGNVYRIDMIVPFVDDFQSIMDHIIHNVDGNYKMRFDWFEESENSEYLMITA